MATRIVRADFDSVYRAHFADVRRFVFHLVQDVSLADELTQDAFLKALDAWGGYRGEAPERVWLLRIARNVCLDHLRSPRSRRRAASSLDLAEAEGREVTTQSLTGAGREPPLSVEQAALQAEMTDCVQQFVLSLPETLRAALILHDMQGLTNDEIAQVLGCSLEAAKMRLHRAREKLRQMMEQRCDLFHDERNVLSCLPAPPETAFVSLDEIANSRPA
jgi:RNA polymerase sigma-70 factor (ECF subfamily)